jgi:NADH:ubiquinone oxidoreductase subunit 6 (subunit J)
MSIFSIVFYGFEFLAAISAISILFVKSVFQAALLLITCLLSLAGIFVLSSAEFVAVTQILIYAGGVLVLIIFGIMLTSRLAGKPLIVKNQYIFAGSLMAVFFSTVLIKLFSEQNFFQAETSVIKGSENPINRIGISLMSDYVLPLEIAGVLLLIALIGAAVTASSFNIYKKQ